MSDGEGIRRDEIEPARALAEASRIGIAVERKARWHGWVWLAIAVATPLFLLGTATDRLPRSVQFWLAVAFMVVTGALAFLESRRGVVGRETAEIDRPLTWIYVAAMVVVITLAVLFDTSDTPLWFLLAALAAAVPGLVAAWRILNR